MNTRSYLALAVLALAVALPGCHILDPQPDPTRFYVLTPMSGPPQSIISTGRSGLTIGLGPVNLPDYLDQQWIVTRGEGNQLYVSADDQWGEPLRDSFKDVLKQDLVTELANDQIIDYPWYRTTAVDQQIVVDVINFEFNRSANSAEIRADWRIVNVRTGTVDARGQFVASQSVAQSSGLERAAALSKLVAQLAQTLAQQLHRRPAIAQDGMRTPQPRAALGS